MYQLDSGLQGKQGALISSVVSIIIYKISSVKAIIYLGAAPHNKLYLLVLTDNEEQRQAQGLAGMIEDSCREMANVVALVHHSSALFTGLKLGNRFMNHALNRPPVYLSGDLLLPPALPLSDLVNNNSLNQWEHWYKLATDFWDGAQFHLKQEADDAALFCLHQSAECVLVALVRAVSCFGDLQLRQAARYITRMHAIFITPPASLPEQEQLVPRYTCGKGTIAG